MEENDPKQQNVYVYVYVYGLDKDEPTRINRRSQMMGIVGYKTAPLSITVLIRGLQVFFNTKLALFQNNLLSQFEIDNLNIKFFKLRPNYLTVTYNNPLHRFC